MLRTDPAVFAVGKYYQIIVTSKSESMISVKVGTRLFVDDANGILRSSSRTHRFNIPSELLNSEKKYTVMERVIIKRLPYHTPTRKEKYYDYDFYPVPETNAKCYHIADAHNVLEAPVKSAEAYGNIDFLILNGDIPNHSGNIHNFETIFDIAARITHGNKPVVFARGNHDLRGRYAELFADYTPADNGNTFYTFRIGSIWGICLDCGEDKDDSHEEYGHTVACHQFREKETEFLKQIVKSKEYNDPSIKHKIVVVHNPFTMKYQEPFNIEPEIFTEWSVQLKKIGIDLMICGHLHRFAVLEPGDDYDAHGHPCKIAVASYNKDGVFGGAGFEFKDNSINAVFNYDNGEIIRKETFPINR